MAKSSDSTGNVNSFGTFLESLNSQAPPGQQAPPSGAPLKLLTALASSGPRTVPDLMSASGLAFSEFTDALTTMKTIGLVSLDGPPGQEQAALTASGEQMARLAG